MEQDGLDKFIKNQIEHLETPADPDLFWQKLQDKQKAEKKPRRRFFFFLGGAMLAFIAFYGYSKYNFDDRIVVSDVSQKVETLTTKLTGVETKVENNVDGKGITTVEIERNDFSTENKTSDIATTSTKDELRKNVRQQQKRISNKSATQATGLSIPTTIDQVAENGVSNDIAITNRNTQSEKSLNSISLNRSNLNQATEKTAIVEEVLPVIQNTKLPDEEKRTIALLTIPTIKSFINQQVIDTQFVNQQQVADVETLKKPKLKKWFCSTGVAFGYGFTSRDLSARDGADDYLQLRKDMETPLDAIRINADFMLQHKSGFYMKSGLEFEQVTERFDSYVSWDSVATTPQVTVIRYAQNGGVTNEEEDITAPTEYFIQKKIYNRYRSFDIPLLVGYQRTIENKKWGWFVEGGAALNVQFKARGEIINVEGASIRLEDNDQLFKTRTGLSLVGNVGLTYQLTNRISCWTSPSLKYHLGSISSRENLIDQKFTNIGWQIGARYHL